MSTSSATTPSTETVVEAYVATWNETDASRRLADVCGTLTGAPSELASALPIG